MGQSAGGDSVILHLLSPMSKDLFQQAIIQSAGVPPVAGFSSQENSISRAGLACYQKMYHALSSAVSTAILSDHDAPQHLNWADLYRYDQLEKLINSIIP